MWKRLRQPLSLKKIPVAVGLVLLAGFSVYGLYRGVSGLLHRVALQKSIPPVLAGVRSQREVLLDTIEAYKGRFGYYPPMLTPPGPDRGVFNPLCYELMGVRFDPRNSQYQIPITKEGLPVSDVQKFFNTRSFSNCLPFPTLPTNFLINRPLTVAPLTPDGELFGVGVSYTDFTPEAFWQDFEFTPWRYATNPAQHNPGKFDIWVEINVAGKHFTIGNWTEVQ